MPELWCPPWSLRRVVAVCLRRRRAVNSRKLYLWERRTSKNSKEVRDFLESLVPLVRDITVSCAALVSLDPRDPQASESPRGTTSEASAFPPDLRDIFEALMAPHESGVPVSALDTGVRRVPFASEPSAPAFGPWQASSSGTAGTTLDAWADYRPLTALVHQPQPVGPPPPPPEEPAGIDPEQHVRNIVAASRAFVHESSQASRCRGALCCSFGPLSGRSGECLAELGVRDFFAGRVAFWRCLGGQRVCRAFAWRLTRTSVDWASTLLASCRASAARSRWRM